jgi:cytochrome bd-type quinol oxidase subunit 2
MYQFLVNLHSGFRYIVLLLLLVVIIKSLQSWLTKKAYTSLDNKLSLWLLIATHLQLVFGLLLYFISPAVQFNSTTMKDASTRYWTVEHFFMMILAIVLITIARISHKKLTSHEAKHKRLFLLNVVALIIIVVAIVSSHRGLIIPTKYQ